MPTEHLNHRRPAPCRGNAAQHLLCTLPIAASFWWYFGETLPVAAEGIGAIVALAKGTPSAEALLAAELRTNPTPSRRELRSLRTKVNEALIAQFTHSVAASAVKPANEDQIAASFANWDALNDAQRWQFLQNQAVALAPVAIVSLVLLGIATFLWRWFRRPSSPQQPSV